MKSKNTKLLAAIFIIILIIATFSAVFYWEYKKDETKPDKTWDKPREPGVEYLEKEFTFSDPVVKENGEYMNVYINGSDFNSISDGRPVLPVNLTTIELPFGTKILNVSYEYSTPEIISISKKLAFGSCSTVTGLDKKIYNKEDPYPSDFVIYHTGGGLSDGVHKTFLVIRIYPIVYWPFKDQLEFIKNIKLEITYKEPLTPLLEDSNQHDLLIIAPSKFIKSLQPLVNSKNKHEVNTKIISVEEVYNRGWYGRDQQEKIKYFIKDAIERWGIKYVLLVGGIKGQTSKWYIPIRHSHVMIREGTQETPEPEFISDLYYADIYDSEGAFSSWDTNKNNIFAEYDENNQDKMDLYPDVYLGRLPCRNKNEVKTMVNKINNYEKDKLDENWFKKLIIITGDHWADEAHISEGELIGAEAIDLLPDFEPVKIYASEMTINKNVINNALNSGAGFVYFCGHGTKKLWGTHYPPDAEAWTGMYEVKHMRSLKNKEKLPITVVGGCNNGQFDVSLVNNIRSGIQEKGLFKYFSPNPFNPGKFWKMGLLMRCWAWKLTGKDGGGAIATIANTALGTHAMNDADNNLKNDYVEIYDGWLELRFFQLYGEENQDILGENHGDAITDYLHRFLGNNDEMDTKMVQQWELFGDPSLKIGGYE